MMPRVVDADVDDVALQVTSPLQHLCPFKEEVDQGTVTIRWAVRDGRTIELHSLAAYLKGFANTVISHEELTERIRDAIEELPGISKASVSTTWTTAGMEVQCFTWPTLADRW